MQSESSLAQPAPRRNAPDPRRRSPAALAAAVLLAGVAPATPAAPVTDLSNLSLEQLLELEVGTASRFDQKIEHAPSAVQVITAREIRAHGWRTLGEALESLPGLYVSHTGLYAYLGARGQLRAGDYDTRFLLLVDGHRINDPVYSQSPVGHEVPLDMSLVERIEYVPGPGSAVYGSNAFFGVINVLTRAPADMDGGRLALSAGGLGYRGAQASLGGGNMLGQTLLSVTRSHSTGQDYFFPEFADGAGAGWARGMDEEDVRQLMLRHQSGGLSLLLLAGQRDKQDPVAPYGQLHGAPGAGIQDRWIELGVQYGRSVDDTLAWQSQLDVIDYRYLGDYLYDDGDGGVLVNRDVASGLSLVLGSRLVSTAFARHTLVAGFEAQLDRAVEQVNYDLDPYASYLRTRNDIDTFGVFVNDEMVLGGSWRLNGGLRLDRSDIGALRLSPRLALVSTPPGGTTFKAIVGKAYRSPNAYERFYHVDGDGSSQLANPSLGAESIVATELFAGRNLDEHHRLELSLYRYRLRHLITLVGSGEDTLTLRNAASASSTGAELSFLRHWDNGSVLRASYSYARVDDSEQATPLNAPRGIARVSALLPLADHLTGAASAIHVDRRATRDGWVAAYTRLDANLLWEPPAPFTVSAGVRNLLDEDYADPAGPEFTQQAIPQRGREYRIEWAWRF
ncbi:TonB-dependent receptor plug domain-containing protein [Pseudoxanthomonas sp. 10H]|uniref:TonB-dependent receptor plug domain-containing protein n=1 Tax=Pseudoxanthomonas sp. 10H TaxID=3242729 RepID=UPI00355850DF